MNPQYWQAVAAVIAAYAALLGGVYAVMTRPLIAHLSSIQTSIEARLDEIMRRLERIEKKLDDHSERITHLEERKFR